MKPPVFYFTLRDEPDVTNEKYLGSTAKLHDIRKKLTTELYYFHVSVGWTLAINFDILIVKTSKNTKMQIFLRFERLDQKLPKGG